MKVLKQGNRLPRDIAKSPSLEIFKLQLNRFYPEQPALADPTLSRALDYAISTGATTTIIW